MTSDEKLADLKRIHSVYSNATCNSSSTKSLRCWTSGGFKPSRGSTAYGKTERRTQSVSSFAAFVRRAEERTLSGLLVEATVFLASARTNPAVVLRDQRRPYKVDTDAIALKVKTGVQGGGEGKEGQ